MPIRVLFVCAGNICRSPMAEALFRHQVEQAGLTPHFEIASAGTGNWHAGQKADQRTLSVLEKRSIPHHSRAQQITRPMLAESDYVLAMDTENLSGVRRLADATGARIELFLEAARRAGLVQRIREVPDPYYDGTFEQVYELVEVGSAALLAEIRAEHHL